MSFTNYADAGQAAGLVVGVSTDDITSAWLTDADQMIETLLGYSLSEAQVEEYVDVRDYKQNVLQLKNYPITSLLEVIDNAQASSPVTIDLDDIVIDANAGIIRFKSSGSDYSGSVYSFTKGVQSVKVTYKWGYTSVPVPIKRLATYWVARLAQQWLWEQDYEDEGIPSGGFKKLTLSRFSVTLDTPQGDMLSGLPTKFDASIIKMMAEVKNAYARDIHLLSTESIGVVDPPSDPTEAWM